MKKASVTVDVRGSKTPLLISSLMLNAGTSGPPDEVLEDGDSQDVA